MPSIRHLHVLRLKVRTDPQEPALVPGLQSQVGSSLARAWAG